MTRRGHSLKALLVSVLALALGLPFGCALPLDANLAPVLASQVGQSGQSSRQPRRVTPPTATPDPELPADNLITRHRWLVLLGGVGFIGAGATALAARADEGDAAINVGATFALITGTTFMMTALFSR